MNKAGALAARVLKELIGLYKMLISPYLPRACRFTPTCSVYAMEALERHGLVKGLMLSVARVVRCNPLCDGGYDPVP